MEMAQFLGSRHICVETRPEDIAAAFPQVIWHAETPVVRTAPAPLWLLSERVRQEGQKVVLTGEGADEVFGGYDLFKEAQIRRFWARRPDSRIRPRLLERLYSYLEYSPTATPFARDFFGTGLEGAQEPGFGHLLRWRLTQRAWRFFAPDLKAALSRDPVDALRLDLPAGIANWHPLSADQYLEARTLLAAYLLAAQGDRMAMAHAVETRQPFLDPRIIAFASSLPPRLKVAGLKDKVLLRRTMAPILPPAVVWRPKRPYRAPDAASFFCAGDPVDYVADLFSEDSLRRSGLFDPQATLKLFLKCKRQEAIGFADNMAFVGILSTLLLQHHFCRVTAAPIAA